MGARSVSRAHEREPRADAVRNHAFLIEAATAAVHREGPRVPMATIAADARVGIGTLYRHFPSREALLEFLTHRSFERVLGNALAALAAQESGRPAAESLRQFIDAAIAQRNELVLPLHGGPPVVAPRTQAVQRQVHSTIEAIIDRGRHDGTIAGSVTAREIVTFGAMLAQPRRDDPAWDALTRRLLATYVAGLAVDQPTTGRGA